MSKQTLSNPGGTSGCHQRGRLSPSGFTLIELIITVAIVSILAAVAYPSYREYIDRSRRSEAQSLLMEAAQWMERFYAENYRYDQNTAGVAVADLFGARFSQSPRSGAASYTISVPTATQTAFVVRATRTGSMSGNKCGNFEITGTGVRQLETGTFDGSLGTQAQAMSRCWR